ncbi:uncharacterized protein LOC143177277 [Calliopsis andreniformis]|uniref:uncharacterized protein LOC143177277 n=1 Tax=Calliopsis andreniformis TaxID=337506 RepID=UPI003FCC5E69
MRGASAQRRRAVDSSRWAAQSERERLPRRILGRFCSIPRPPGPLLFARSGSATNLAGFAAARTSLERPGQVRCVAPSCDNFRDRRTRDRQWIGERCSGCFSWTLTVSSRFPCGSVAGSDMVGRIACQGHRRAAPSLLAIGAVDPRVRARPM